MKKKLEPIDVFIKVLNEAVKADKKAINYLIDFRVDCNKTLARHKTIQVATDQWNSNQVGLLGIINGIAEELTGQKVMAVIDYKDGLITSIKFKKFKNKPAKV